MSPPLLPDPASGHDGDEPPLPADGDDWDADAYLAWFLATLTGADLPGGQGSGFGRDEIAETLRPGAPLWALAEQAAADPATLTRDELLSMVSAGRRLAARAEYLELAATGEFARRARDAHDADAARGVRPGRRAGEFAATELAFEMVTTDHAAADRMDFALALTTRLPHTRAGLGAGSVDGPKASAIWYYTRFLSDADAAEADAVLAAAAPGLRYDSLARKAARLEMKLDPEAVRARKEQARKDGRRVEARRELSGNMAFGGRELGIEEALAAKSFNDGDALALRRAGMPGTLRELRIIALLDRIAGRNPFDRLTGPAATPEHPDHPRNSGGPGSHDNPDNSDSPDSSDSDSSDSDSSDSDSSDSDSPDSSDSDSPAAQPGRANPGSGTPGTPGTGAHGSDGAPGTSGTSGTPDAPGAPMPIPALINLLVPAGTLLGWSTAPGDAGTWGLLDPDDTRTLVHAASQHPRTRWCVTVTGSDGTAIAHGCARGQHPWTPPGPDPGPNRHSPRGHSPPRRSRRGHSPPRQSRRGQGRRGHSPGRQAPGGGGRDGPGRALDGTSAPPGPDQHQAALLAALLRALNVTLSPIAVGTCDHRHREDRYTPSRSLKHLVRARTATCPAPGCGAQSIHCDLDHTLAYPDGLSCECNFGPPCRHHHRVKQAPGWHLEQPAPGVMKWTTPSGRVHTTTPTVYDT